MEIKTHEEMLDKYIGEVGTPERDAFDAKVLAGMDEVIVLSSIDENEKIAGQAVSEKSIIFAR